MASFLDLIEKIQARKTKSLTPTNILLLVDDDNDFYVAKPRGNRWDVVGRSEGSYQLFECDDIDHLKPAPSNFSPTKLAEHWFRSHHATWEVYTILMELIQAKLPGDQPPSYKAPPKVQLSLPASSDLVTLAVLCTSHGWSASQARRILRKELTERPDRWEWPKDQVPQVVKLIEDNYRG